MKKLLSILLALAMVMGLMAGCGSTGANSNASDQPDSSQQNTGAEQTGDGGGTQQEEASEPVAEPEDATFTLEYPADMQAMGFTDPIVLDTRPEQVVCLSTAPVLALYELGVNMVGVPSSRVVTWPEDLAANAATVSFSVMSPDDFDYEAVVALEPDLVFLAINGKDTAGAKLESLGIPVYYLYAGHTVSYESIKMQTEALIAAFDIDGAGETLMQRFADLEVSLDNARTAFAGKSVMVLQSGSAEIHYIQTKGGTLGSMLDMIGFENVYVNETSSMVQLDYEQALDYNPDYVVCVGATDAAAHQTVMEEAFGLNPDYWNAIPAVENGSVVYVDVTYCSTAGINIIDNITALIGIMSEATGVSAE